MNVPTATYRIQLNDHFRFCDLDAILDYLRELGISTIYASPVTRAFAGSQHGYDVADPLQLNPEIGTEEEFGALAAKLRGYGMDWLQDIVPNHMAYSTQNPWLYDVLERGKVSPYYSYFDLQSEPVELLGDRIMAPFLGSTLTDCLQKRQLGLEFAADGFVIRYFDQDWPVATQVYTWICTVTGDCPEKLSGMLEELAIASLSPVGEWKAAKAQWLREVDADPLLADYIRRRVDFFNARVPLLETLLGCQQYALTHHRLSSSVINYRRFFTVNSLICLRMEDQAVFEAYHRKLLDWRSRGLIQGLRVDHIDGLAAPAEYIGRLREKFGRDCYLVAEKILARDEALPGGWDLQGTTGYEFLAVTGQVLTDAEGSRALLEFYRHEVMDGPSYPDLVTERKYFFLRTYMGGELDNLMELLYRLPRLGASGQEAGRLREALAMLLACWPVYRLYPDGGAFSAADRVTIASAFDRAKRNRPECREELVWLEGLFGFVYANPFVLRLMQFTGPLAAKGIEDTSFYIYNPYIAHNEVGDTPVVAGIVPAAFHTFMRERQLQWPHSLNATTTHDTKRGEDARIRLNLLGRQPAEWIEAVRSWREINRPLVAETDGRRAPSLNDEYLIYQALLGGWPDDGIVTDEFRERFSGYLRKALREAGTETNYDDPDEWYEGRCQEFAAALLAAGSAFLPDFGGFAAGIIRESYAFSLAQLLLKLTSPGIPDIYQGAECWETSFVDPDNRRPVDYGHRMALLREMRAREAAGAAAALGFVLDHPERGVMKMWVIYRVLNFRRAHPELFADGDYLPVNVEGPALGYIRRSGSGWVLVLVPLIRAVQVPLISGEESSPAGFRVVLPKGAPVEWVELFTADVYHAPGLALEWPGWERFPVAMLVGR
jgi:(1->4)-alpha-D-glucan 1-alpha-D-glucosylmutase